MPRITNNHVTSKITPPTIDKIGIALAAVLATASVELNNQLLKAIQLEFIVFTSSMVQTRPIVKIDIIATTANHAITETIPNIAIKNGRAKEAATKYESYVPIVFTKSCKNY